MSYIPDFNLQVIPETSTPVLLQRASPAQSSPSFEEVPTATVSTILKPTAMTKNKR